MSDRETEDSLGKIKDFTAITFASSLVNIDSIQNVTLNISPFQNKLQKEFMKYVNKSNLLSDDIPLLYRQ